jgi:hypothetical protein
MKTNIVLAALAACACGSSPEVNETDAIAEADTELTGTIVCRANLGAVPCNPAQRTTFDVSLTRSGSFSSVLFTPRQCYANETTLRKRGLAVGKQVYGTPNHIWQLVDANHAEPESQWIDYLVLSPDLKSNTLVQVLVRPLWDEPDTAVRRVTPLDCVKR